MFPWQRKRPQQPGSAAGPAATTPAGALVDYLVGQIASPARAGAVLDRARRFQQLAAAEQQQELPALYILLEQYLVEVDPGRRFTRPELRERVRADYGPLLA